MTGGIPLSCYHHLSIDEREKLYFSLAQGRSVRKIAAELRRSPSTITRELQRNAEYTPSRAQRAYEERRKHCVRKPVLQDPELHGLVHFFLGSCFWSPEQISHRLQKEGHRSIGTSTIYRALDTGLLQDTLRYYLRFKYKTHGKNPNTRKKTCFSSSITDRPPEAAARSECGHFEGDTVHMYKSSAVTATLVDRRSRYLLAGKLATQDTESVNRLLVSLLSKTGRPVKSITFDQGVEFSGAYKLAKELSTGVYFAHPHAPWERPTNENTNGLLRQFIPKYRDCRGIEEQDIQRFVAKLNLRPRKCLNWATPFEVFFQQVLHFT